MPTISDSLVCSGELPKRWPTAFSPGKYLLRGGVIDQDDVGRLRLQIAPPRSSGRSAGESSACRRTRAGRHHPHLEALVAVRRPSLDVHVARAGVARQKRLRGPASPSGRQAARESRRPCRGRTGPIAPASYPLSGGFTLNSTRFCVLKPTSTLRRFWSVRRNSPAPTSSTSEMATCDDEQPAAQPRARRRPRCGPSPSATRKIHARRAQRRQQPEHDAREPADGRATNQRRASRCGSRPRRTAAAAGPSSRRAMPSTPPSAARSTLSVSSCRMSRERVAPIDRRTEISLCRDGRARQQQVRDVRADDEQHEHDDDARSDRRARRVGVEVVNAARRRSRPAGAAPPCDSGCARACAALGVSEPRYVSSRPRAVLLEHVSRFAAHLIERRARLQPTHRPAATSSSAR